jgi:hypothetical protein
MSVPLIWSTTPSDNQTVDSATQWQEGQPASSLNNSARGMMARLAMARDDSAGTLVATVSSTNVFTLNTNQSLVDPTSTSGGGTARISKPFVVRAVLPAMPTAVATSAPTIVIDGAGAVPLTRRDGSALQDGDLSGVPYELLGDTITSGAYGRARILNLLPSDVKGLIPASASMSGQCRLTYVSTTQISLAPLNGNQIVIGGKSYAIPAAGVTLANTSLTAGTLYYVYAFLTGTTITLEASTTGHATDATTGTEIKSGDSSRSLVGMVYMDVGTPGTFADTAAKRYVASWFNRRRRLASSGQQEVTTSSVGQIELTPFRAFYLAWAGETVVQCWAGSFSSATGVQTNWTRPYLDGAQIGPSVEFSFSGAGLVGHPSHTTMSSLTEGRHSSSIGVFTNSGNNVTWKGKQDAEVSI